MNRGRIVDCHTHMFPTDIPARWDWYAAQDSCFAELTRETPQSRVREAWATPEEALRAADRAGVELIVMQGWYWRDMDLCRRHNDYMEGVVRAYPGRFAAYASINPVFGEAAVREVERCRDMGFSGVGELGPGGNGYSLDHPGLLAVLETAERLCLPVCFHVGEPVGHVYPGKDRTPIEGFYDIARRFPDLRLILAHMGGGLPFYELLPHVRQAFRNVWYDLAANPLLYDIRAVTAAVRLAGPERVLFGTDFPLTIYPRQCQGQDFSLFIQDIEEHAGLTEAEWELVMGANMRRLLEFAERGRNR